MVMVLFHLFQGAEDTLRLSARGADDSFGSPAGGDWFKLLLLLLDLLQASLHRLRRDGIKLGLLL